MTRIEIYDQDRKENYEDYKQNQNAAFLLPLTRSGFENLLKNAAEIYNLPVDDRMREVLAGYVHHIPNEENETTLRKISAMLYKSVSNSLTWMIDHEIKEKRRQDALEAAQKAKLEETNVINMPPRELPKSPDEGNAQS